MRLRQIEVFHAVYTAGSITAAAAMLHVSQPSVSKVLAHAEQQLGYLLFDRVKGKLVPTPEAHRLFSHVAQVYQDVDTLRRVASNLRSADGGVIRIAAAPAFAIELLPRAIADYRHLHPHTVFEIETLHHEQINDALLRAQVDLGLAFDPLAFRGIAHQILARGQCVVAAPPTFDFGPCERVRLEDIAARPFIALNSRGPLGQRLSARLEAAGQSLNTVAVAETYQVAKALVANGVGVAIIDGVTALSGGQDGLSTWPLDPPIGFQAVALHLDSEPLSVGARRFVTHLRTHFEKFLDCADGAA